MPQIEKVVMRVAVVSGVRVRHRRCMFARIEEKSWRLKADRLRSGAIRLAGDSRRVLAPPADLGRFLLDKFFVQPATPVMSPPNLSVHKPTGNCASRYNDCPLMPSRCTCRVLVQFEYFDVDGCEAGGCHRGLT